MMLLLRHLCTISSLVGTRSTRMTTGVWAGGWRRAAAADAPRSARWRRRRLESTHGVNHRVSLQLPPSQRTGSIWARILCPSLVCVDATLPLVPLRLMSVACRLTQCLFAAVYVFYVSIYSNYCLYSSENRNLLITIGIGVELSNTIWVIIQSNE